MPDVAIDMTQDPVEENNDQDFVRTHMRYVCLILFLFATTAGISTFAFDVYEGHRAGMEIVFAVTFVDITIPTILEACGVVTLESWDSSRKAGAPPVGEADCCLSQDVRE